jgi:hypothetical protein
METIKYSLLSVVVLLALIVSALAIARRNKIRADREKQEEEEGRLGGQSSSPTTAKGSQSGSLRKWAPPIVVVAMVASLAGYYLLFGWPTPVGQVAEGDNAIRNFLAYNWEDVRSLTNPSNLIAWVVVLLAIAYIPFRLLGVGGAYLGVVAVGFVLTVIFLPVWYIVIKPNLGWGEPLEWVHLGRPCATLTVRPDRENSFMTDRVDRRLSYQLLYLDVESLEALRRHGVELAKYPASSLAAPGTGRIFIRFSPEAHAAFRALGIREFPVIARITPDSHREVTGRELPAHCR